MLEYGRVMEAHSATYEPLTAVWVEMPLGFLEDEKDLPWNPLDPTLPIYI